MGKIQVQCPACSARLDVSEKFLGRRGRCKRCGNVFTIEVSLDVADAPPGDIEGSVMSWLGDGPPIGSASQASPAAARPNVKAPPAASPAAAPAPAGKSRDEAIRLGHVDDMGAFFLFTPELLRDPDFRASFPQRCLLCGSDHGLSVHLVLWSSKLPFRGQFGTHTSTSCNVFELAKLGRPAGHDLLGMLQPVANLPEPYSLPFPYYVCRSCSAVGALVTDVRHTGEREICELGFYSMKVAEDFLLAYCGPKCPTLKQLRKAMGTRKGDAWQALPLAVRSRIRQWYQAAEGERFVAYVSDNEFAKTEAGMAGVVVTDRRMVFHKFSATLEAPFQEPIAVRQVDKGGAVELRMAFPEGKEAKLAVDEFGASSLREHLRKAGAKLKWAN